MSSSASVDPHAAAPTAAEPIADASESARADQRKGLRALAIRGSAFEIIGYGTGQVLRLASNLVLSRLLFPRAFGLAALVSLFNTGLVMLSDVGIEPAVVQNPRGDDPRFLNTAWSIQFVRGFILWGIALVLAWPLSVLYNEPDLFALVCVGSASVAVSGMHSTSLFTLRRHLRVGMLNLIDIGSQVFSVAVMIPWAIIHPTPWLLVVGSLAGAAFRVGASYVVQPRYRNHFLWDPESRKAITTFGKWILGSSAIFFASRQSDRLLLGKFLGVAELGVYSIAVFMSEAVGAAVIRVVNGVLYPVFSRVSAEGTDKLRALYYRTQLVVQVAVIPAIAVLAVLGPQIIDLMYDSRYSAAGWMLQILCLRVAMNSLLSPCETCLFSTGQTRWGFYSNVARVLWIAAAVPIGWHFGGLRGLVWGTATCEIPVIFVLWGAFARAGMLRLRREAISAVTALVGLLVGIALSHIWHWLR